MFSITKPSENRIDIKIDGTIDGEAMRAGLDDLIANSEEISHGSMLYTITNFSMPTLGAMGVEFAKLPKLFQLLSKFDRCAVISNESWIRTAAEIEGAIIPGLKIKSFEFEEVEEAETWLAETVG